MRTARELTASSQAVLTAPCSRQERPPLASPFLTLPQSGASDCLFGTPKAQLSADHTGRHQVPLVVTDGPPFSIFEHLHAALPDVGTASQSHQGLLKRHTVLLSTDADACSAGDHCPLPLPSPPPCSQARHCLRAATVLDVWMCVCVCVSWVCRAVGASSTETALVQAPFAALAWSFCPGPLGGPSGTVNHSSPQPMRGTTFHQHFPHQLQSLML